MKATTIRFENTASRPRHALALIYDLEGFSQFFNQPDVQDYVPKFLNRVSEAMGLIISGGDEYWKEDDPGEMDPLLRPTHEKFLGDGALYLWIDGPETPLSEDFVKILCNRLWVLKANFTNVVKAAYDEIPVVDLPRRIRFGMARGTVYELATRASRQKEYIGFCINLASRLQKYCPELGFIASARIGLPKATLDANSYLRVAAKQIKGFPREIVIVDADEYERLDDVVRQQYFDPVEVA